MNRNGFAPIILLIVIGLALIGGGVWYWQQKVSQNQILAGQSQSSSVNWKTFSNQYIQFSHPSDWRIQTPSPEFFSPLGFGIDIFNNKQDETSGGEISFYAKSEIVPDTFSSFEKSIQKQLASLSASFTNRKVYQINGIDAIAYDVKEADIYEKNKFYYGVVAILDFKDYFLEAEIVNFDSPEKAKIVRTVFDSIRLNYVPIPSHMELSSLDVASWKKLDFVGITLSYPSTWTVATATQGFNLRSADVLREIHLSILPSTFNDFVEKVASSEIRSTKNIKINDLFGKLHDIENLRKNITMINLIVGTSTYSITTQHYDDPYIHKIIGTVNILSPVK